MFLSCLAACDAESAHAELLKAPYKAPSVRTHHHSLLEPQNPLTAPKWLLLLFFVLQSASYKWPHSTPVWHLTGLWIPLPEKPDPKNNTLRCICCRVRWVLFWLHMSNLNGPQLDANFCPGKKNFWKRIFLNCFWRCRAANTGTYEAKKVRSYLFISQRLNSGLFSVLISRKGPQRLNVKLKATITLHDFFLNYTKAFQSSNKWNLIGKWCQTGCLLLLWTSRDLCKRQNSRSEEDRMTAVIMCEFAPHVCLP